MSSVDYRGGCAKGMPMVGACHRACGHRAIVQDYRDWRERWEARREDRHHMQLEPEEYRAMYPPPTFRDWLLGRGGDRER